MERPHREEFLNAATHGLGTILSLVAAGWMLVRAWPSSSSDRWELWIACLLYGVSLVGVFLFSALSHLPRTESWRQWFRKLDQAFIYLLIVSTYTPFARVHLNTPYWNALLAIMWLGAIAGFLSKLIWGHRLNSVSVVSYIALGWLPGLAALPLLDRVPMDAAWGIVGGGVLYTLGTLFLLFDHRVWYFHAVWHGFVIAGAATHWWTTMVFVL